MVCLNKGLITNYASYPPGWLRGLINWTTAESLVLQQYILGGLGGTRRSGVFCVAVLQERAEQQGARVLAGRGAAPRLLARCVAGWLAGWLLALPARLAGLLAGWLLLRPDADRTECRLHRARRRTREAKGGQQQQRATTTTA